MTKTNNIFILNWIRGICAILVVLGHSRSLGWASEASTRTPVVGYAKLLLAPTGLAVESVAVFFVLSGYFVGGKIIKQITDKRFSWASFLIDRGTRLYTVLVPGLVVTYLSSSILKHSGELTNIGDLRGTTFICNLLFLMPNRCNSYGNNSSLWSLGYEFYFYLLFALIANIFAPKTVIRKILIVCLIIVTVFITSPQILILFPAWLIGTLIYFKISFPSKKSKEKANIHFVLGLALLGMSVITLQFISATHIETILGVSLGSIYFIWSCIQKYSNRDAPTSFIGRYLDLLGRSSFSIYIFHLPLLLLGYSRIVEFSGVLGVLQIYFVSLVVVVISIFLYYIFESKTFLLRDWIKNHYNKSG